MLIFKEAEQFICLCLFVLVELRKYSEYLNTVRASLLFWYWYSYSNKLRQIMRSIIALSITIEFNYIKVWPTLALRLVCRLICCPAIIALIELRTNKSVETFNRFVITSLDTTNRGSPWLSGFMSHELPIAFDLITEFTVQRSVYAIVRWFTWIYRI